MFREIYFIYIFTSPPSSEWLIFHKSFILFNGHCITLKISYGQISVCLKQEKSEREIYIFDFKGKSLWTAKEIFIQFHSNVFWFELWATLIKWDQGEENKKKLRKTNAKRKSLFMSCLLLFLFIFIIIIIILKIFPQSIFIFAYLCWFYSN